MLENSHEKERMEMNVKDVPNPTITPQELTPVTIAAKIYERQMELEDKYWQIEKRPSRYIEVNSREGQILIKDFLWRAMEEVGEAMEPPYTSDEKFNEEMADGLHFVAGLCTILNRMPQFQEGFRRYFELPYDIYPELNPLESFVVASGTLGNCLKLKPWKQSDVSTDLAEFNGKLVRYVYSFLHQWNTNLYQVYDYYWRKSEVNLFRIRSNY